MLKLTMNPRKRSRRSRQSLRHRPSTPSGRAAQLESEVSLQKALLADNIDALHKQEATGNYKCVDYLSLTSWQHDVYQLLKKHQWETRSQHQVDSRIDEFCREQIVEWSFRVVDYFRIDREVVAVSLSFLDRFLATCHCDRTSFKLAATTTLHLAVKLLYPCKLGDLGILSDLSRGEFNMIDVAEMESHILDTLDWNLHPPSTIAFTSFLLDYAFCDRPSSMSTADVDDLYDIASFFTELAVCDYYFVTMRSSQVAIACILNALEGMFGRDNTVQGHIVATARALGFAVSRDIMAARHRLWELYERSEECALHNSTSCDSSMEEEKQPGSNIFVKKESAVMSSPVTVASNAPCKSMPIVCPVQGMHTRNGSW